MNLFRELVDSILQVRQSLIIHQEQQLDNSLEWQKLKALFEIKNYVQDMEWITQKRTKERILFYLKNQCSISKTADHYNAKHNTIRVAIHYASKKLEEKIGRDTIKQILRSVDEQELNKIMEKFYLRTDSKPFVSPFLMGVTRLLPKPKQNRFILLEECYKELVFLTSLSNSNIHYYLSKLDKQKLAHIMGILMSNEPTIEKEVLLNLFNGDFLDQNKGVLKSSEQVKVALNKLTT
ncbi:ATP-binding protein [Ureibacillus thermosphaericus]|uniref:hypothetical protein n=1 Tax=Ureibacillus thermosphaericus TaxID=51173 RepID=UPI000BBC9786|nr:hypothetical protein [Ureibacillus thermosphaericus]